MVLQGGKRQQHAGTGQVRGVGEEGNRILQETLTGQQAVAKPIQRSAIDRKAQGKGAGGFRLRWR